ncbi:MAG: AI-2E family transporter [Betaproteobacteria bacterium]|nr:AI-2E family transporter [Betaproteobacteria bacterium]
MEKRIEQIVQISLIALLVIGCLLVLRPFVTALLSAAILCYSTWPLYRCIEQTLRGWRATSALIMTVLIIVVLVLPLALIAASFRDEIPYLAERVRTLLAEGLPGPPGWVVSIPLVGETFDAGWREIAGSQAKLAEALKRLAQPAREVLVAAGIIIAEGVLQFTLIAFIGFFFYRDGAALVQALHRSLDRVAGHLTGGLLQTVGGTINSVVYGIIGTGLAQGLVALIGFLIAGVPGALMLGFLTFFFSIIPGGAPVVWVGATIWLFYQDQAGWALFMALWGFFGISGIDNVVKPLLISRGSQLSFLLVMLGVFGGVLAFGFVGVFLGPTLLAVGFNLMRHWAVPQPAAGSHPVPPRS